MPNELLKRVRFNPATGQDDYFFPMEIKSPSDVKYAEANGLEIGLAGLGRRTFKAVMIPCKRTTHDAHGHQVYLETPSEEQHRIYKEYIRDELIQQDKEKQDGRCRIPDAYGGLKRCPVRVQNPAYIPGSDQPKTLRNRCDVCSFERFKYDQASVDSPSMSSEEDDGEKILWNQPAPESNYAGDLYEDLVVGFIAFVKARHPKLVSLAEKLVQEYSLTEASAELGKSASTLSYQKEELKKLLGEFLDNAIIF